MLLFFFFIPLFASNEQEEEEYDEEDYYGIFTLTYDGLSIKCDAGCGIPETRSREYYDPDLEKINTIFTDCVRKLNQIAYECNYIPYFYNRWQNYAWECTDPHYYSIFRPTSPNRSLNVMTDQHNYFLEAKAQFLTDFTFYSQQDLAYQSQYLRKEKRNLRILKEFEEEGYGLFILKEDEEGFPIPVAVRSLFIAPEANLIDSAIREREQSISLIPETILRKEQEFDQSYAEIQVAFEKIDHLFKQMFIWCLEHHQSEGIAFSSSLESLIQNDVYEALQRLRFLISFSQEKKFKDELLAKLYLLQGQVESEFSLFADALVSLTTAITKNPAETEVYFERAAVYFELGQYEQAVADYLKSDVSNLSEQPFDWLDIPALSTGILTGIQQASAVAALEFVPGMIGSLMGIGHGLWAFALDPAGVSLKFCEAALQCVDFLKNTSTPNIIKTLVPELKELIEQYDQLSSFQRGSLIGTVIGKYGVEIFCGAGSVSGAKHYLKLKKANRLLTLEAFAQAAQKEKVIQAAAKRFAIREQVFSNKNRILKIHQGRQNKHTANHSSCTKTNSILTVGPEKLLEKAGTGTKDLAGEWGKSAHRLGTAGSQEVIDFGEVIGTYYDQKLDVQISTTWGKIHYAKDNWVHIVPTKPR